MAACQFFTYAEEQNTFLFSWRKIGIIRLEVWPFNSLKMLKAITREELSDGHNNLQQTTGLLFLA